MTRRFVRKVDIQGAPLLLVLMRLCTDDFPIDGLEKHWRSCKVLTKRLLRVFNVRVKFGGFG